MKAFTKLNLKTNLVRFFQIVLLAILCFSLVGCAGSDPDEPDWDTGISLEGVKVLRKPLSYSFDENVPENDGTTDFYYHFAGNIINYLFNIYGNLNNEENIYESVFHRISSNVDNAQVGALAQQFETNPDDFVYFYDAIRYQISSVNQDAETQNYVVTADTSKGWNWSLPIDNTNYEPWVLAYQGTKTGTTISTTFDASEDHGFNYISFSTYYSNEDADYEIDNAAFQSAYVNQDYINGLTYAIYSLVLGLEPAAMSVDYSSGSPVLSVEGYAATADKTSAEVALANVKLLFNQLGSYVGLTERNKTAIAQFILDEIIGETAQSLPYFYDLYYEDVVSAIVDYCGTLTTIGQANEEAGEGETTVGDSFMASEVMDFPATSFMTAFDQEPFAYLEAFGVKPSEYQSFVLMPLVTEENPTIRITDIWLDFEYDANRDGREIYDENLYLDIEVIARWNKGDGSEIREAKKTMRVYDGPADPLEDGTTLEIELETEFGEVVEIGKFNEPDALKTTEEMGHKLTLTGFTDARRYYKVIESTTYGGYGVLDESRIEGSYLEIAFNVIKTPGDTTTNYAFHVAISNLHEESQWPGSPEFQ